MPGGQLRFAFDSDGVGDQMPAIRQPPPTGFDAASDAIEIDGTEVTLTTPVDASYGPFADGFSADQHRFGPFDPIRAKIKEMGAAQPR